MQTKQQRLAVARLKSRYTFATRIPEECYDLTIKEGWCEVTGLMEDLPTHYCTVSSFSVSGKYWREVFNEEQLQVSERLEREVQKAKASSVSTPLCVN